jgi:hypothetical protein
VTLYWGLCTGETPPGCSCSGGGGGPPPGGGVLYEDIVRDAMVFGNHPSGGESPPETCSDSWATDYSLEGYDFTEEAYYPYALADKTLPEAWREDLCWLEDEPYDAAMSVEIALPYGGTITPSLRISQAVDTSVMQYSADFSTTWSNDPWDDPAPCDNTPYGDTVAGDWVSPGGEEARRVRIVAVWTAIRVQEAMEPDEGCVAVECDTITYTFAGFRVTVSVSFETEETT